MCLWRKLRIVSRKLPIEMLFKMAASQIIHEARIARVCILYAYSCNTIILCILVQYVPHVLHLATC